MWFVCTIGWPLGAELGWSYPCLLDLNLPQNAQYEKVACPACAVCTACLPLGAGLEHSSLCKLPPVHRVQGGEPQ